MSLIIKDLVYALSCLAFTIIIGAAVYEHLVVWPQVMAAPPLSLSMYQGEYAPNGANFWTRIHPVILVLLITSLVLSWRTERKKYVLITLIGYVLILVSTAIYYVPELIEIVNTPYAENVDEGLVKRGVIWQRLSIVRLILLMIMAILLYLGLTKQTVAASR